MVGTDLAFWIRNARAWAIVGARLTPSAPRAPSATETPPDRRMKSRRESVLRTPVTPSTGGVGRDAAMGTTAASCESQCTGLSCDGMKAYTASGRAGERLPPGTRPGRRRSHMFKKSEEQEWTRFRGALSKDR